MMLVEIRVPCNICHHLLGKPLIKYIKQNLFPHLQRVCHSIDCQEDAIANFCADNNCAVVIVPHYLTNTFHPLDIMVNKPAKLQHIIFRVRCKPAKQR